MLLDLLQALPLRGHAQANLTWHKLQMAEYPKLRVDLCLWLRLVPAAAPAEAVGGSENISVVHQRAAAQQHLLPPHHPHQRQPRPGSAHNNIIRIMPPTATSIGSS